MAKLQVPPVYSSNESFDMVSWFKLLWKWVTDLYTAEEVDDLIEANRVVIGTPVTTTSGTAHDYTGIPAGTRRITVNFSGVSTNGTSDRLVQIGDSGGVEATGYVSTANRLTTTNPASATSTAGFLASSNTDATEVLTGQMVLTLLDASAFTWVCSGCAILGTSGRMVIFSGAKSLSAELDRVRLTTVNGTDAFDAGSVNITYER